MITFFRKVWKDPVFSIIIATVITTPVAYIYGFNIASVLRLLYKGLATPLVVHGWVVAFLFLLAGINIPSFRKLRIMRGELDKLNKQIENRASLTEDDIFSKVVGWWPKAESLFPEDVKVDFCELEKILLLPEGSVTRHIDKVAKMNHFKQKARGQTYAVYECDIDNAKLFGDIL